MESLPPPHDALRRAEQSAAALRAATTFTEFTSHWQQLLQQLRRCWSQAERHYLRHPKWAALHKPMKQRIDDHRVAGYLWHAREAGGGGLPKEAPQPFDAAAVPAASVTDRGTNFRPPVDAGQVPMALVQVADTGIGFYKELLAEIDATLK